MDNFKPALFLHIPKTAGTSIVTLARQAYGAEGVCSHGDFIGRDPQSLQGIKFVSGHFGYNYAAQLMKNRYSFVFLRDPIERILSSYYFCLSRDPDEQPEYRLVHENSLERYLEISLEGKQNVWNLQTRLLAGGWKNVPGISDEELYCLAKEHISEFSYVGFAETFDKDFRIIFAELGMHNLLPIRTNTTEKPRIEELGTKVRKLLEKSSELDRSLYDHVRLA